MFTTDEFPEARRKRDAKMKMRILNIATQERRWYLNIIRFTVILSIHFKYHYRFIIFQLILSQQIGKMKLVELILSYHIV